MEILTKAVRVFIGNQEILKGMDLMYMIKSLSVLSGLTAVVKVRF